jgi:asparagine synthase (glutamine-hydrolysing)
MCMANSIEARTPFLDHGLMQFCASLPVSYKLNGTTPKRILKDISNSILPPEIIKRPKHTFDVPIGKWIKGSLRELTLTLLSSGEIGGAPLFNPAYILGEMWQGLEADLPGYARQFWALLNLALWAEQYKVQMVL